MSTAGVLFPALVLLGRLLKVSSGDAVCIGRDSVRCPPTIETDSFYGDLTLNCSGLDFIIEYNTKVNFLTSLSIYADCSNPCHGIQSSVYYYDYTDVSQVNLLDKGIIYGSVTNFTTNAEKIQCHVFGCFTYHNGYAEISHNFMPMDCPRSVDILMSTGITTEEDIPVVSSATSFPEVSQTTGIRGMSHPDATSAINTSKMTIPMVMAVLVFIFIAIAVLAVTILILYMYIYTRHHKQYTPAKALPQFCIQSALMRNDDINIKFSIPNHLFSLTPTRSQLSVFDGFYHKSSDSNSIPVDSQHSSIECLQKDSGYTSITERIISTKGSVCRSEQEDGTKPPLKLLTLNLPLPDPEKREKLTLQLNGPNVSEYYCVDDSTRGVELTSYEYSSYSDCDNEMLHRISYDIESKNADSIGNIMEVELQNYRSSNGSVSEINFHAINVCNCKCFASEIKPSNVKIMPKWLDGSLNTSESPEKSGYVPHNLDNERPNLAEASLLSSTFYSTDSSSGYVLPHNPEPNFDFFVHQLENETYQYENSFHSKEKCAAQAEGEWQERESGMFPLSNEDSIATADNNPNYSSYNENTLDISVKQDLSSKVVHIEEPDQIDLNCELSDVTEATNDDLFLCTELILNLKDSGKKELKEVNSDYIATDL